ncbi:hypothetical protein ACS0TY_016333 [Phlomoides rotata]
MKLPVRTCIKYLYVNEMKVHVQHLIEECIIFNMSKEECMEALDRHANIKSVITSTVWKELEKENNEFFEAYTKKKIEKKSSEKIKNILLDSPMK